MVDNLTNTDTEFVIQSLGPMRIRWAKGMGQNLPAIAQPRAIGQTKKWHRVFSAPAMGAAFLANEACLGAMGTVGA